MAITQAFCNQAKADFLGGVHQSGDTYKIALYTSAATLDATTSAYSATNEVSGTGYTAGGATLSGFAASLSSTTGILDFSDPSWPSSTLTARGALIYNSSKSNKALCVLDFGTDKISTNGTFAITLPTADSSNALLRVA